MTPFRLGLVCLLLTALAPPARAQFSSPTPVKNFSLPFFNDEGYHTMLVRGREALLTNPQRIGLTDMTLTLFAGDAAQTVDTVVLSPTAFVLPGESRATGPGIVRLVRDDLELTGNDWVYDQPAQTILIKKGARIIFRSALTDLLK